MPDYQRLLAHYQDQAEAMVSLKVAPPPDFLTRVVSAADRWRSLDGEPSDVCQQTAKILQTLGRRELAGWDYLTTPIGDEADGCRAVVEPGVVAAPQGELDLADRAFCGCVCNRADQSAVSVGPKAQVFVMPASIPKAA